MSRHFFFFLSFIFFTLRLHRVFSFPKLSIPAESLLIFASLLGSAFYNFLFFNIDSHHSGTSCGGWNEQCLPWAQNLNIWFSAGGTAWGGGAACLKKVIGGGLWGWFLGWALKVGFGRHTQPPHTSTWLPLLGVCGWRCNLGLLLPQLAAMPLPTLVGCPSGIRSENKPSCVHCPRSLQQQGRNPSTSSASLLHSPGSCQFLRLRLPFLGFLSSLVRAYH